MSEVILQTKLFTPPLRPLVVPRPRLLARLEAGVSGKLSLISAPAGFGKTTLTVHWLQQQERPVAWLSLDENDNAALRFFTYAVAAIQTVYPDLAADLATSLRSSTTLDETAVVTALLNELAGHAAPFILVLDDYHAITNEAIHNALAFFVDHLPDALHVIITSREDPPFPLPRWRVRGQLTHIQAVDLRFTTDESDLFLRETMGLALAETAVADLETRTEGWVAGLQLAALSLRNSADTQQFINAFMGSDRQIADYLLQEVLFQQPPAVQNFLLQTSILERFNAALCNALLDRRDGQDILESLEQNNLFIIPLDNSRFWYRYHHLFAELLRYRLQRDAPVAIAELHRRAAGWFEAQELLEEAIAHAFQIPDHDYVARLISTIPVHYLFEDGGSIRIQQWVKRLPPALLTAYPYVAALMAGAALVNGQARVTYEYLAYFEAEERLQPFKLLLDSILMRNATGDHQEALRLAQQALAGSTEDDLTLAHMAWGQIAVNQYNLGHLEEADEAIMEMRRAIRGTDMRAITMQLQAIELQSINAMAQGNLKQAERLFQEGIALATRDGRAISPLVGVMYTGLGNVYYRWNELDHVEAYTDMALDWARRTGISDLFTYSAFLLANLACSKGDKEALEAALRLITSRSDLGQMAHISMVMEHLSAMFWLRLGALEAAAAWADASGLSLADDPTYDETGIYRTLVATRLAQSRQSGDGRQLPAMLAMVEKLEQHVIASHNVAGLIEVLALKALVLDQSGDPAAVPTVQRALDLARPGNMLRAFLDWGEPMRQLLRRAASGTVDFHSRLLSAFAVEGKAAGAASPLDQLTDREFEILQLIAAGLSNKQIEEQLFISKNTVRTHIKNLYSKLGVTSRTQAIKQAHELGLLP